MSGVATDCFIPGVLAFWSWHNELVFLTFPPDPWVSSSCVRSPQATLIATSLLLDQVRTHWHLGGSWGVTEETFLLGTHSGLMASAVVYFSHPIFWPSVLRLQILLESQNFPDIGRQIHAHLAQQTPWKTENAGVKS